MMRHGLIVIAAGIGLFACTAAEPVGAVTGAAVTGAEALRPLDFCGNSVDEDGDGRDRVCSPDATAPATIAVLRGTAEPPGEEALDAEVLLIPDGDASCPNPPSSWPSVEACVGRPSCSIQVRAKVRLTNPSTGALVSEYTLGPRQCHGAGTTFNSLFTWTAQESKVIYSGTALGFGGSGDRLTLRSTASGSLTGAGTVLGSTGSFYLDFVGVKDAR